MTDDTKRLDWISESRSWVFKTNEGEWEVRTPYGFFRGPDVRAAVDAAMSSRGFGLLPLPREAPAVTPEMIEAGVDVLIEHLRDLWRRHPQQRLSQLIYNCVRYARMQDGMETEPCPDVFYAEDDVLLRGIHTVEGKHKA